MENIKMVSPKTAKKLTYDTLDQLIQGYKDALENGNLPKNGNREEYKKYESWFDKTELKILNLEEILSDKD
jgi:hypothetical protein